jgi:predicted GIY-YIG superfamily endonuclease
VEPNQTYYVKVASDTHDGAMGSAVVVYMSAKTSVRAVQREEAMKSLPQAKSVL